jgi:hypothetical protein
MARINLAEMTVPQLVERFTTLGIAWDEADTEGNGRKINRLYWQIDAVQNELKARPGDARNELLRLYDHKNPEVRLKAARATLAVAPEKARKALEAIAATRGPQALDAGMAINALDQGIYKPT